MRIKIFAESLNIVQDVLAAGNYKKLFPKFHAEYLFAFADRRSGEVFRIF